MAAAVAYYVGLSLLPLLLVLISGIGVFFQFANSGQRAEDQLLKTVSEQLSPTISGALSEALAQVEIGVQSGPTSGD